MWDKLTSEGKEEVKYVIESKKDFPTYKCPYIVGCELENANIHTRWNNREECLICKNRLVKLITSKGE